MAITLECACAAAFDPTMVASSCSLCQFLGLYGHAISGAISDPGCCLPVGTFDAISSTSNTAEETRVGDVGRDPHREIPTAAAEVGEEVIEGKLHTQRRMTIQKRCQCLQQGRSERGGGHAHCARDPDRSAEPAGAAPKAKICFLIPNWTLEEKQWRWVETKTTTENGWHEARQSQVRYPIKNLRPLSLLRIFLGKKFMIMWN
jgi:hypothetical protein